MINFIEYDRVGLGNSGVGPYMCSSYCFLNNRLILSLYEPNYKKGKVVSLSIDSSGSLSIVDSSEVYPSGPNIIVQTDGIFTDGTYIYQCLTTDEGDPNKYTLAWGYSGDAFVYPSVTTKAIHGPHGHIAFGDGYIFSTATTDAPFYNPNLVVASKFDGVTWTYPFICQFDYYSLLGGYPLFYREGCLIGAADLSGPRASAAYFDDILGFTNTRQIGWEYAPPMIHYIIESQDWCLINNSITKLGYSFGPLLHEFDPGLPDGRAYHSVEDNILSISTTAGLYCYESGNAYRTYGIYEPTKSFYFHLKFGNFDIIMDNDLVSNEYQIKSGKLFYHPDYTTSFYARPVIGNNPLTVSFTDLSA